MSAKRYVDRSFRMAMFSLILLFLTIVVIVLNRGKADINVHLISGIIFFSSGVSSMVGSYYLYKGKEEWRKSRYIVSFVLNAGILILFLYITIGSLL